MADIIYPYSEEDLLTENLLILDDFFRIFVWIGTKYEFFYLFSDSCV
jgi:hypothetical protein